MLSYCRSIDFPKTTVTYVQKKKKLLSRSTVPVRLCGKHDTVMHVPILYDLMKLLIVSRRNILEYVPEYFRHLFTHLNEQTPESKIFVLPRTII